MGYIGNQSSGIVYTNLKKVKGTVDDIDALSSIRGMINGDLYIQKDNNHARIYNGNSWIDLGVITGPQGPVGVTGPQGPAGVPGIINHIKRTNGTGASGTTDTYTAYADADETVELGTFDVYNGANGDGAIASIVAGTNVTVDASDANNPVINVVDVLPDQTNSNGKFLSTNGTEANWSDLPSTVIPVISISSTVNERTQAIGTITNYDINASYTIIAAKGDVKYKEGNTFIYTAPDITDGDDDTDVITAYAIKAGELKSKTANVDITVHYVDTSADTTIQVLDIYNDLETNTGFKEIV